MNLKSKFNRIKRFYFEHIRPRHCVRFYREQGMKIGKGCHIGRLIYTDEAYLIEIGDHVAIAAGVLFITHDPGLWCLYEDYPEDEIFGKITIGNNVLIGMKSILLPNTTIGKNSIVGAGSVVRGHFPDNSVIFGNPAKAISTLSVQKLLYSQHPGRLKTGRMSDAEKKPIVKRHFGIR